MAVDLRLGGVILVRLDLRGEACTSLNTNQKAHLASTAAEREDTICAKGHDTDSSSSIIPRYT